MRHVAFNFQDLFIISVLIFAAGKQNDLVWHNTTSSWSYYKLNRV